MESKVNILADDKGRVVRQSNLNSKFGHVRLQQTRVTFGNGGWVKKSNVSTLLHGTMEDLNDMGIASMKVLPGKIIIKEQVEPFSVNNQDRDLKMAGQTGIICCVDGQPIYRKTFFVADATAQDVLIAHDNGLAIKEANSSDNSVSSNVIVASDLNVENEEVKETEEVEDIFDEIEVEDTFEVEEELEEVVLEEEDSFEL
jgi:hypothetical protein